MTGSSRATPSSTAFSTSQSTRPFLTGAKASHRSGTVSCGRVGSTDGQRHPLLAGLGDLGQPFARHAVEQQQLVALLQPHDIAEIIGLGGVELDRARPRPAASRRTGAAGFAAARRGWRAWPPPTSFPRKRESRLLTWDVLKEKAGSPLPRGRRLLVGQGDADRPHLPRCRRHAVAQYALLPRDRGRAGARCSSRSPTPASPASALEACEVRNLKLYGYGAKAFTLSMIETALELGGDDVPASVIRQILEAGTGAPRPSGRTVRGD